MNQVASQNVTEQPRRWKDLYQKFRPFQLKGIVGQESLVRSISNAAKRDSFNHAYMLAGAYGSGPG